MSRVSDKRDKAGESYVGNPDDLVRLQLTLPMLVGDRLQYTGSGGGAVRNLSNPVGSLSFNWATNGGYTGGGGEYRPPYLPSGNWSKLRPNIPNPTGVYNASNFFVGNTNANPTTSPERLSLQNKDGFSWLFAYSVSIIADEGVSSQRGVYITLTKNGLTTAIDSGGSSGLVSNYYASSQVLESGFVELGPNEWVEPAITYYDTNPAPDTRVYTIRVLIQAIRLLT